MVSQGQSPDNFTHESESTPNAEGFGAPMSSLLLLKGCCIVHERLKELKTQCLTNKLKCGFHTQSS